MRRGRMGKVLLDRLDGGRDCGLGLGHKLRHKVERCELLAGGTPGCRRGSRERTCVCVYVCGRGMWCGLLEQQVPCSAHPTARQAMTGITQ